MAPSTPFGNVMAPPVYSDPPGMVPTTPLVVPAAGTPVATTPPPASAAPTLPPVVPPSTPAAPTPSLSPPPGTAPAPVLPTAAPVPYGKDFLTVSPNGLVAPIGSEMLLKAGIIAPDRHLIPYQRIDWSINRTGVGQFTKLGFRDFGQFWGLLEAPQKLDDWSAITSTAVVPITLNTSTHNPNDDVPIYRGESWVTVTSATEGTSLVTAYAPAYSEFNQATSTIYWVDAQWIFPQPAIVEPGRSHTLTTTLMRRSDGAPLAGWIVQYNVSGGALGYEGGSSVDTTTDANGRASVEVNPKDPGGGVTNVGITIVRPQTAGPAVMPRLNLGRSAVTITWAQGGTAVPAPPIVPSIPGGAPITSPPPTTFTPPPALPPTTTQPAPTPTPPSTPAPSTYTPPPAPVGKPQLEATLRTTSTNQVTVGGYARFDLTVTNRGDGVARHVLITARFDRGLRHPNAKPNEYSVVYTSDDLKELEPNESQSIPLTFQVVDGGTQCTDVTVTADGAEAVSQRGCVTARQAALEVSVTGPRSQVVGDAAKFNVTVRNVSDVAATNIELVIHCDPAILPTMAEKGSQLLADGGILLKIDRLEAAERRTFGMEGQCRTASNKACAGNRYGRWWRQSSGRSVRGDLAAAKGRYSRRPYTASGGQLASHRCRYQESGTCRRKAVNQRDRGKRRPTDRNPSFYARIVATGVHTGRNTNSAAKRSHSARQ